MKSSGLKGTCWSSSRFFWGGSGSGSSLHCRFCLKLIGTCEAHGRSPPIDCPCDCGAPSKVVHRKESSHHRDLQQKQIMDLQERVRAFLGWFFDNSHRIQEKGLFEGNWDSNRSKAFQLLKPSPHTTNQLIQVQNAAVLLCCSCSSIF